jgi:hypothetical protein
MRKIISLGLIFITVLSSPVFAAAGYAKDGPEFSLVLILFLLLVAGIDKGIDYLRKNRKTIVPRLKAFIKEKFSSVPRFPI